MDIIWHKPVVLSNIIGFEHGVTTYELENGSMVESEFIKAVNELIYKE